MRRPWTIVQYLPPLSVEDGVEYQAIVQFSFRQYLYSLSYCKPDFNVEVAYVHRPPPDDSDFCRFESKNGYKKVSCRRRKHLLNFKWWMKVGLKKKHRAFHRE
ncbi:hypothetical protein Y032_0070g469 [Ancylostoma ceylanicum]|nr:hypothetical protein Y032_0070g469 [Ancylostoma ceylanicum]